MPLFLVRTNLSRGDLRLFLSNDNGYAQDAASVSWTVFDSAGNQVSGKKMPAIRAAVGEYYAPWFSDVRNGNYLVQWELREDFSSPPRTLSMPFFVVDPASYQCQSTVCPDDVPVAGGGTLLSGTSAGRGDLPLFLKDGNGVPANGFTVLWTIYDVAGNPVSATTVASQAAFGEYFASWFVNVRSGDYVIKWQYQFDSISPVQSASMPFSVVNPALPFELTVPECNCAPSPVECLIGSSLLISSILANCAGPAISACSSGFTSISVTCPQPSVVVPTPLTTACACDFEIPRIVHLPTQTLPPSGAFTSQVPYTIPPLVRNITFYISYTRGASGGFAVFKLLWGNGQEEVQETTVSFDLTAPVGPSLASPTVMSNMSLQALQGPAPPDNNPINFILYVGVPGGAKTVRLLAAEAGQPGAPGTLGITLTASTG